MEQHGPSSHRSYAPSAYSAQQTTAQVPSQYATPGPADRFRPTAYAPQSPTAPSSMGGVGSDAQPVYGFQASAQYESLSALQPGQMQYTSSFPSQDPQRPAAQQSPYQQYGPRVVYGMPQMQTQPQPQSGPSTYDQTAQYRQRPGSASETLPSAFGVPQTAQYYLAGQNAPASVPAPDLPSHAQQFPSQYQQAGYPQPDPSAPQPYPSTMIDPSQSGVYPATYAQQQHQQQQPAAAAAAHYSTQTSSQSVDQAFVEYQSGVRRIFTLARDRQLRDVGQHLLQVSRYLLSNVETLGLTRDDDTLHDDRIRLWDEFNNAWLTSLQQQHDMTEEMIQNGRQPAEPQSILSVQSLEDLSKELVRLCDNIERHGLVDFQMGVAEEQIIDLILRCLALLDPSSARTREAAAHSQSSSATAAGPRSR